MNQYLEHLCQPNRGAMAPVMRCGPYGLCPGWRFDYSLLDDDEMAEEIEYWKWAKKMEGGNGCGFFTATQIFCDELNEMIIDKKMAGEDYKGLARAFWLLQKKTESEFRGEKPLNIGAAKEYPITELIRLFGYEPRMNKIKCPFHEDKTASMHIFANKNRWHCFGCATGGDTIDFMMKMRKCSFPEAVKMLTGNSNN